MGERSSGSLRSRAAALTVLLLVIGLQGSIGQQHKIGDDGLQSMDHVLSISDDYESMATEAAVLISWEAVEGATGYDLQIGEALIFNLQEPRFLVEGLKPGTRYTYKVRSRQDSLPSGWSSSYTVMTAEAPQRTEPLV